MICDSCHLTWLIPCISTMICAPNNHCTIGHDRYPNVICVTGWFLPFEEWLCSEAPSPPTYYLSFNRALRSPLRVTPLFHPYMAPISPQLIHSFTRQAFSLPTTSTIDTIAWPLVLLPFNSLTLCSEALRNEYHSSDGFPILSTRSRFLNGVFNENWRL